MQNQEPERQAISPGFVDTFVAIGPKQLHKIADRYQDVAST